MSVGERYIKERQLAFCQSLVIIPILWIVQGDRRKRLKKKEKKKKKEQRRIKRSIAANKVRCSFAQQETYVSADIVIALAIQSVDAVHPMIGSQLW
ncbi:hypothetical protein P167DRAFT_210558 [Morchella conica CCBAS932]|uniref:Uncharacterized protein n=1 Tax=Morchella conica CCBAS932 TaxID=1392247 RepID=A0A3N4KM35_9PEZI|nr:hypothetical protein P167DRAFT_210558 [Morchella conica CCBAS932]